MKDNQWDIKQASDRCRQCGAPHTDGGVLHSILQRNEEGYERNDFCPGCGRKQADESVFSAWRSVYRAPQPPAPEPLKKETAESLLRRLMETDEEEHRRVIFILAVMLERRRILIEQEVRMEENGCRMRVYEHRHTREVFLIPDPELKLAEIERVQHEVTALIEGRPAVRSRGPSHNPEPVSG